MGQKAFNFYLLYIPKYRCADRGSNPGHKLGRLVSYHCPFLDFSNLICTVFSFWVIRLFRSRMEIGLYPNLFETYFDLLLKEGILDYRRIFSGRRKFSRNKLSKLNWKPIPNPLQRIGFVSPLASVFD